MPWRTLAEASAVAATCSAVAEAVFENDASKALASLKGTDSIASGKTRRSNPANDPVPVRDELIPDIFLIKIDFVLAIETAQLVLEQFVLVMFFLIGDVPLNDRNLSISY